MNDITALIIDDDPLLRTLIARFLKDLPQVQIVGSAENASQGVSLVHQYHPTIVIMDIQLPDNDVQSLTREVKNTSPSTKVYLCSAYPDDKIKTIVGESGADGFVSKADLKEGLSRIIQFIDKT